MAEQTNNRDMSDEPDRQDLEDRVDQLESTISKILPGRRDALKLGGAALVGGAAMSGSASAGTQQAGTIGTSGSPVDVESEDINNADTITTENLVVNQSATVPFGGAPILEPGDTVTVEALSQQTARQSFETLYNGSPKDVLGGTIHPGDRSDFLYTFSNNTTLKKIGSGTTYSLGGNNVSITRGGTVIAVDILPPAVGVKKIEVGTNFQSGTQTAWGAEVILKD